VGKFSIVSRKVDKSLKGNYSHLRGGYREANISEVEEKQFFVVVFKYLSRSLWGLEEKRLPHSPS
jgi:hypothetical protein